MTDIEVTSKENIVEKNEKEEISNTETVTQDATVTDTEDEFADAVDEDDDDDEDEEEGDLQAGDAAGLSMVISALQGTVQQQQQQQQQSENIKKEINSSPTEEEAEGETLKKNENNKKEGLSVDTSATVSTNEDSEPGTPVPSDIIQEQVESKEKQNKKPDLNVQTDIRKSIDLPADKNMADYVTPPTPGIAPTTSTEIPKELKDHDFSQTNTITPGKVDLKNVLPNTLGPREQEKYGNHRPSLLFFLKKIT